MTELENKIRDGITAAMRSKNELEKNILRLALGEIQLQESKRDDVTEEQAIALVRKIVLSNNETLKLGVDLSVERREALIQENSILTKLLPQQWSQEQIEQFFNSDVALLENIKQCKSDGQSIGLAMKSLKLAKAPVDGDLVKQVVASLRSAN